MNQLRTEQLGNILSIPNTKLALISKRVVTLFALKANKRDEAKEKYPTNLIQELGVDVEDILVQIQ